MSYINVDADKLVSVGEEVKTISTDYGVIVQDMYEKLTNVSNNGVWTSESEKGSANIFIAAAKKDKTSAESLVTTISDFGENLVTYGKELNNVESTNK